MNVTMEITFDQNPEPCHKVGQNCLYTYLPIDFSIEQIETPVCASVEATDQHANACNTDHMIRTMQRVTGMR